MKEGIPTWAIVLLVPCWGDDLRGDFPRGHLLQRQTETIRNLRHQGQFREAIGGRREEDPVFFRCSTPSSWCSRQSFSEPGGGSIPQPRSLSELEGIPQPQLVPVQGPWTPHVTSRGWDQKRSTVPERSGGGGDVSEGFVFQADSRCADSTRGDQTLQGRFRDPAGTVATGPALRCDHLTEIDGLDMTGTCI